MTFFSHMIYVRIALSVWGVLYDAAAGTNPNPNPNPVPYGIPVEVPPIDVTGGERLEMTNNVYHNRG